jgi:hypothetical protein
MDPKGMVLAYVQITKRSCHAEGVIRSCAPKRWVVGRPESAAARFGLEKLKGRVAENVGHHFEVANDGDFLREHEVNILKSS